jgi:tetratricopeptide (TPR) repeat protein
VGSEVAMMDQSHTDTAERDQLVKSALHLFIQKARREDAEARSWIRQPNNFISAVAIVLSLLSVAYQLRKDYTDGIDKDLAALSSIVSDINKLESDALTTSITNQEAMSNFGTVIANRRVALLAEADRLINGLGNKAPNAQLAILGPEYVQIGDYDTALKDFVYLTQPTVPEMEQISAWRSIAILYFDEGPDKYGKAREAFTKAAQVQPDPKGIGSINVVLEVREQWSSVEMAAGQIPAAFAQVNMARALVTRLPCLPEQATIAIRVESEAAKVLAALKDRDPVSALAAETQWQRTVAADTCAARSEAQSSPKSTEAATSSEPTTICEFARGPRAGTRIDFKSYGVQPIPVGSPCTDGMGSNGIAVR